MTAGIFSCGHCLHKKTNATSYVFASVMIPSKCDRLKDEPRQAPGKGSPILQLIPGLRMQVDKDADMERNWKSLLSLQFLFRYLSNCLRAALVLRKLQAYGPPPTLKTK